MYSVHYPRSQMLECLSSRVPRMLRMSRQRYNANIQRNVQDDHSMQYNSVSQRWVWTGYLTTIIDRTSIGSE
ncbi:hypothetical protein K474DRAFT_1522106 [Panus rudis PR-1116 ss-1]|nr:hypothetical protein K474DRAFT_1522106 [Panus rudis PR-1116 ss-1]